MKINFWQRLKNALDYYYLYLNGHRCTVISFCWQSGCAAFNAAYLTKATHRSGGKYCPFVAPATVQRLVNNYLWLSDNPYQSLASSGWLLSVVRSFCTTFPTRDERRCKSLYLCGYSTYIFMCVSARYLSICPSTFSNSFLFCDSFFFCINSHFQKKRQNIMV